MSSTSPIFPVWAPSLFYFYYLPAYWLALVFVLPYAKMTEQRGWLFDATLRNSWPVVGLTVVFFTFSDVIIDPVALQGERWFLGKIYGNPHEAIYFGIPLVNFAGWAVVALMSFVFSRWLERGQFASESVPNEMVSGELFLGIGLYYGVLAFNLGVTFWIVEVFMGMVGCFIVVPLTAALLVTLCEDRRFLRVHDALK